MVFRGSKRLFYECREQDDIPSINSSAVRRVILDAKEIHAHLKTFPTFFFLFALATHRTSLFLRITGGRACNGQGCNGVCLPAIHVICCLSAKMCVFNSEASEREPAS